MAHLPHLYAYREYITDKASYAIEEGVRIGETPNIAMDAGSPELAARIVKTYKMHNSLVALLADAHPYVKDDNLRRIIGEAVVMAGEA